MTVNAIILAAIAGWVLWPSSSDSTGVDAAGGQTSKQIDGGNSVQQVLALPVKADITAVRLPRFGISTPHAPWSRQEVAAVASAAGTHPTLIQYFNKWTEDFRPEAVSLSYDQHALPMLSWEPWAGASGGECQSAYTLSKIINGTYDPYIAKFAAAVAHDQLPIAIRLAHEMNGHWYPWSEQCPGNHKGEFVKAWRHIHDMFSTAGATNVIWVWSPNIIRPVPNISLKALYPGDAYVDWIGLVGYAVHETTASAVFDPTIALIRRFSKLPIVITETGAESSPHKSGWIRDFFRWLPRHPDVIGFIWFEYSRAQGGSADWRFTETAATRAAFHDAIRTVQLAGPPASRAPAPTPTGAP
jgi:glycosyl hydrolase family 26